ncbi:glycoside hydrolase family 108 protein [Paracoccus sp. MA]|uniref:glycoside hydrolase family 108 protein n=1 Tax=Paracoccus sp. MA TaxID=2895796 RepID=UPI001E581DA5|nr:glycoside hydrolase family 108 protein [Paracoccus sp. MA]UFM63632.1 glycoside hydrolase family 108 protein [Paracoccus sp. MA]
MKTNFDRCLAEVLRHEGGYVNDPHDPGGETNMGISKRSYPQEDIKGMTRARAAEIYRRDYWNPVRGDDLPAGMDLVAFDAAVNSGVSRGAKWLQTALGVSADGKIGPQTIAAAKEAHPEAVIDRAVSARLAWLRTLKTWSRFGKGWTSRVESVREVATAMAKAVPVHEPAFSAGVDAVLKPSGFIAALLALLQSIFKGR